GVPAQDRLADHQHTHPTQHHRVDHCCEDLGALPPVGAHIGRRAGGEGGGEQRAAHCGGVADHVSCIGLQRQRSVDPCTDGLDEHHSHGDGEHGDELVPVGPGGGHGMVVPLVSVLIGAHLYHSPLPYSPVRDVGGNPRTSGRT